MVPALTEHIAALTDPLVALVADWGGRLPDPIIRLFAVVERPSDEHERYKRQMVAQYFSRPGPDLVDVLGLSATLSR